LIPGDEFPVALKLSKIEVWRRKQAYLLPQEIAGEQIITTVTQENCPGFEPPTNVVSITRKKIMVEKRLRAKSVLVEEITGKKPQI
jgi:hypothetical protein